MPVWSRPRAATLAVRTPDFFRAMTSLTAEGYYTSQIGLMDELGYVGNTALAAFPECEIPEH